MKVLNVFSVHLVKYAIFRCSILCGVALSVLACHNSNEDNLLYKNKYTLNYYFVNKTDSTILFYYAKDNSTIVPNSTGEQAGVYSFELKNGIAVQIWSGGTITTNVYADDTVSGQLTPAEGQGIVYFDPKESAAIAPSFLFVINDEQYEMDMTKDNLPFYGTNYQAIVEENNAEHSYQFNYYFSIDAAFCNSLLKK